MPDTDPIKHVVVVMFENHSFDQMLGCFKEKYNHLEGCLPGGPFNTNVDKAGKEFKQVITTEREMEVDPGHCHVDVMAQIRNKNSGFVRNFENLHPDATERQKQQIMSFYPRGFLPALHGLAEDFTICDHWFSSMPGPTWPNRFFALTGTCKGIVDMPEGVKNWSLFDNFDQDTIFDRLNSKGISWRVYYHDMPQSLVLTHQQRSSNTVRYFPIDQFRRDVEGAEHNFPQFSLIEPCYYGYEENDDHPPHDVMKAQRLLADTYNAIRGREDLWHSTLLVVFYDEHGGFYDHVSPPVADPPDDVRPTFNFNRLGPRVPALLVSPWVDRSVCSTVFDHTSLLKYLGDKWDFPVLGRRTEKANSIGETIQSFSKPRADTIDRIRFKPNELLDQNDQLAAKGLGHTHNSTLRDFIRYMADKRGLAGIQTLCDASRATLLKTLFFATR